MHCMFQQTRTLYTASKTHDTTQRNFFHIKLYFRMCLSNRALATFQRFTLQHNPSQAVRQVIQSPILAFQLTKKRTLLQCAAMDTTCHSIENRIMLTITMCHLRLTVCTLHRPLLLVAVVWNVDNTTRSVSRPMLIKQAR